MEQHSTLEKLMYVQLAALTALPCWYPFPLKFFFALSKQICFFFFYFFVKKKVKYLLILNIYFLHIHNLFF